MGCPVIPSQDGKSLWVLAYWDGDQRLFQVSATGDLLAEVDIPDTWHNHCRMLLSITSEGEALIWSGVAKKDQEVDYTLKITPDEGIVWTVKHALPGWKFRLHHGRKLPDGSRLHVVFLYNSKTEERDDSAALYRFRPPEE